MPGKPTPIYGNGREKANDRLPHEMFDGHFPSDDQPRRAPQTYLPAPVAVEAPKQHEFEPKAINARVWGNIIKHPLTSVPAVVGPVLVLGGFVILHAEFLFMVGCGLMGLGWITAFLRFFFDESVRTEHIQSLKQRQALYLDYKDKELRYHFNEAGREDMILQMDDLNDKLSMFKGVLSSKFTPGELVYERFLGSAEVVHQTCLDNLAGMHSLVQAMASINVDDIRRQIDLTDSEASKKALQQRISLHDACTSDIDKMLALNIEAMTSLDTAMFKIGQVHDDRSDEVYNDAINNMKEMTDIINEFKPTVR